MILDTSATLLRSSLSPTQLALGAAERAWVPDRWIRMGIRRLLDDRLDELGSDAAGAAGFAEQMRRNPVAVAEDAANEQHYEVPPEFFERVLGPRRKYSACVFEPGDDLATAEDRTLALTAERASLGDGMRLLDLGCGWGSFTLWAAEHYPNAQILAVSNSNAQRETIQGICRSRGFANVEVRTANAATLELDERAFDRVVSVEMFEHLRNWPEMFERISRWLEPDGVFLQHTFCHRDSAYFYEDEGDGDWMARHFFSGGIMPSFDLASRFDAHLGVEQSWKINGVHYSRTLEAWLERLDSQRSELTRVLRAGGAADRQLQRWRLFLMACSELFAANGGEEWFVVHHRLTPTAKGSEA